MGYFDTEKGVDEYLLAAEGYDGCELVEFLQPHLVEGSTILELGMGPGKDLNFLRKYYKPTGSDSSEIFVNRYIKTFPDSDVLVLDAINLATSRHFDGIYSNKVLHQLTQEELNKSLESQFRVLNPGGIALHSLWWGEQCEDYDGMIAQHYTQESFTSQLGHRFTVLEAIRYTEMETDDSLCMILKRS